MKELAIHKPKYRAQQQAYQQGGIHNNRPNSHVSDHYGQNLPRTGQAFTTANLPLSHMHTKYLDRAPLSVELIIDQHGRPEIKHRKGQRSMKRQSPCQTLRGRRVDCGYSLQLSQRLVSTLQLLLCQSRLTMDYQVLSYGLEGRRQMKLAYYAIWTLAPP